MRLPHKAPYQMKVPPPVEHRVDDPKDERPLVELRADGPKDERPREKQDARGGALELGFSHGVISVVALIVWLLALYASFKRNKGLSWSVIMAFFFAPVYLIYCFVVPHRGIRVF